MRSGDDLPTTFTFPANQTSVNVSFTITDDQIGLEDPETYNVTLGLTSSATALGVMLGPRSMTVAQVVDDDGVLWCSIHLVHY